MKVVVPFIQKTKTCILKRRTRTFGLMKNRFDPIETCFGVPLPSPDTTDKADFIAECGICYTHHLPLEEESNQGQGTKEAFMVPNVLCGNPKCGRSYHETCLFEWLHSLPDSKISFDRTFGTCPYCMESISVKMNSSKPLFH